MSQSDFSQEWTVLQNQYDAYERSSLTIKLFAIATFVVLWVLQFTAVLSLFVLLTLWLLDAIWKTFQSRIEDRLLVVEAAMSDGLTKGAMQFNQDFMRKRPRSIKLVQTYFTQALRPTIAFPYVVLVFITLVQIVFFPEQSPWDFLNTAPEFKLFE
jgi:hypothetical protein